MPDSNRTLRQQRDQHLLRLPRLHPPGSQIAGALSPGLKAQGRRSDDLHRWTLCYSLQHGAPAVHLAPRSVL